MAAKTGITLVKKFTYRGDATEEFSNTYHFTGSVPSDATAWLALMNALATQEKTIYPSSVSVIRAYGYATDNPADDSVWASGAITPIAGTLTLSGAPLAPGDSAVWCRWKTSRNNSKGKAIYLRKYFHPAVMQSTTQPDDVYGTQYTALQAFGTKLMDGSFDSGRTLTAQTHDDTLISRASSLFITTRTLKRRGKRPGS